MGIIGKRSARRVSGWCALAIGRSANAEIVKDIFFCCLELEAAVGGGERGGVRTTASGVKTAVRALCADTRVRSAGRGDAHVGMVFTVSRYFSSTRPLRFSRAIRSCPS